MKRSDRRSAARLAASQALYQMEITGKGLNDILAEFEAHWIGREIEGDAYTPADPAFFRDVVSGVLARSGADRPQPRRHARQRLAAAAG